jgi:hypothetical protein
MKVAVYTRVQAQRIHTQLEIQKPYFYQCWVALKTGDWYPLVINPYIYTLICQFPKFSKNQVLGIEVWSSKFPKSKNRPDNLWLFDENCQCFAIFEMIRIEQFFDSETFKELELGSWFFKSSKNRPRLVFISHIIHSLVSTIPYLYMWLSGWLIIYCHICNEEARSLFWTRILYVLFSQINFPSRLKRDLCTFIGFHGHNFCLAHEWMMCSWLSLDWCHR